MAARPSNRASRRRTGLPPQRARLRKPPGVDAGRHPLRRAVQGRDGAVLVLDRIRRRFPCLELIWADDGCNSWQVDAAVAKVPPLRVEIVKRSDDRKDFVVPLRRGMVERTFSWFGRNQRLAKDFENLNETLGALVARASIPLALRRLARANVVNSTNHG